MLEGTARRRQRTSLVYIPGELRVASQQGSSVVVVTLALPSRVGSPQTASGNDASRLQRRPARHFPSRRPLARRRCRARGPKHECHLQDHARARKDGMAYPVFSGPRLSLSGSSRESQSSATGALAGLAARRCCIYPASPGMIGRGTASTFRLHSTRRSGKAAVRRPPCSSPGIPSSPIFLHRHHPYPMPSLTASTPRPDPRLQMTETINAVLPAMQNFPICRRSLPRLHDAARLLSPLALFLPSPA